MEKIQRQFIDWEKTGKNLELLRNDNINLRRASCRARNFGEENCEGNCEDCKFGMDNNISRNELAEMFGVSEHVIYNWEKGKTAVDLEDLLFYCNIAKVDLKEIVVFMP